MSRIHDQTALDHASIATGTKRRQEFDTLGRYAVIIDPVHHHIHESNAYSLSATKTSMGVGDTFTLTVVTPSTTNWLHPIWGASGLYEYYIRVYEGATITTPGASVTPVNKNRNSSNASVATFTVDDTISDLGTNIFELFVSSGFRQGGVGDQRDEIILKAGENTVFHLESRRAGNIISGILDWYEHTND
ncbi:MAG: hypothetical protein ACYTBJ_17580 [Planctomycetota bacterium]